MNKNKDFTDCIDVDKAGARLSHLLERVVAGSTVVICRAGKPVAQLVPLEAVVQKKRLGLLKGRIQVPDDFDAPLPPEALTGSS